MTATVTVAFRDGRVRVYEGVHYASVWDTTALYRRDAHVEHLDAFDIADVAIVMHHGGPPAGRESPSAISLVRRVLRWNRS